MPGEGSAHEAALEDAERALARSPGAVDALLARARALDVLGRNEDAIQAYVDVLRVEDTHFGALTGLGVLATKMGQRAAAKVAFAKAVEAHPDEALAHANLAILLSDRAEDEGDFKEARAHFEAALRLDPDNRTAHRGMAVMLLGLGEPEAARQHAKEGLLGKPDVWPFRGTGRPVSLLLVLSAIGANAPIELLLDDRVFQKWTIIPEFFDPAEELPPHDVVFNGIGDVDRCREALLAAAPILARAKAPVLNAPARIGETGRVANAERLARIPGVVTARTAMVPRRELEAADAVERLAGRGFGWPLLLRSPGFHAGAFFAKVDQVGELAQAVARLPGETLLVADFVDTRGPDAKFRKYRVMTVGGQLYPLHLAVSSKWMVHYFSADMAERPDHRAEDLAFLEDMPRALGPRAMQALEQIQALLGLDYAGIDFGIDPEGKVVVFEANAAMAVLSPPEGDKWSYRRPPIDRIRQAVHRMLLSAHALARR
jgi:hypothetical protein